MLPQSVWADDEASLNQTSQNPDKYTLTINSSAAGNLHGNIITNFSSLVADKEASVTKIVLKGYFNADDLSDLKGVGDGAKFTGVTEVDMAEAQFVQTSAGAPSQAYYYLYHNYSDLPTGTTGDRAIVGGTLYKSAQNGTWTSVGAPAEGTTVVDNINTSNTIGYAIGTYGKNNPVAMYVQMNVTSAEWLGPFTKGYDNFAEPSSATQLTASSFANETTVLNGQLNNYYGGQFVYFNRYYKTQFNSTTNQYEWVEGTEDNFNNATGNKYIDPSGVNLNELSIWYANQGDNPEGNVMLVKVYYQKQDNSKEWVGPTPENPADTESATDMSAYEYEYRNNHMEGYKNGEWVLLTKWEYYQFQATSGWHWELVSSYNDGDGYYINIKYPFNTDMSNPGGNMPNADNQYAVVMGSNEVEGNGEYYRNGSSWKDPSLASETPHYVDMRFDYWSATLQKATTSKYADENINPDIFKECVALEYVDFKAGVVKGFGDHTSPTYYEPFTIKIGKDVTKIENAAFRRCDVLTEVEWDTYTDDEKKAGSGYPKELIIEAEAFLQAKNLMSITIPNRCVSIGENAFEQVGTGATTDINSVSTNDYTFTLKFERRNATDTDQGTVAINCNFPLTIGTKAFFDCWYLKDLSLPIRLESMGNDCFKNSVNLTTLTMREETGAPYTPASGHDVLRTIPSGAFEYSGVQQLTIPKSVTKIENKAFGSTTGLTKVTFQNNTEYENPEASPKLGKQLFIESGAFSGGREEGRPQLDIYVMVNPNPTGEEAGRKIICEYAAFNYTQTVGQTSTIQNFANLHFPEEYWDYYQGNWKRGLAFRQDNLNAFKDGYHDDAKHYDGKSSGQIATTGPNAGKYVHATEGYQYTPANGWQEFARTSTRIDIEIPNTGSFMRTYSTPKPMSVPVYAEDDTQQQVHQGDPFFKVYRISHFNDGYTDGADVASSGHTSVASALEVKEHMSDKTDYSDVYIPSNTGLLMAGTGTGLVSYILYMKEAEVTSEQEKKYPWTETQETVENPGSTNLLWPACYDDDKTTTKTVDGVEYVVLNPSYPHPYQKGGHPDLRFFALAVKTVSDVKTYYFSRFREGGVATRDKAYLRLPYNLFHWKDEGEEATNNSGVADQAVSSARVALQFIDDDGETTSIRVVDLNTMQVVNDTYYTLQGVKVNGYPTKSGIYIHNGRKIVIK